MYVTALATAGDVQPDPPSGPALTQDPDDNHVMHLARTHAADFIVSENADFLEWHEQRPAIIALTDYEARSSQAESCAVAFGADLRS